MSQKPAIYTIGHSTRPLPDFIAMLEQVGVNFLVDVRRIPMSRTNPQYNTDRVPHDLAQAGISYRHVAALGGLRPNQKLAKSSPNTFWDNASFRNYSDYAMTANFRAGFAELEAIAATATCAIMCAEAVWWRCHRRIIADYLLAASYPVFHIMSLGKVDEAKMTLAAEITPDGSLVYQFTLT